MLDNPTQLDRIESKLDLLLRSKMRSSSINGIGDLNELPPTELRRARIAEVERIFVSILDDPAGARFKRYKLPKYLEGHPQKPTIEALPVSILKNQSSLRKIFRLRAPSDTPDSTPASRVQDALEDSNLTVVSASTTKLNTNSSTKLVMSPAEMLESAHAEDIPDSFVGWTTSGRIRPRESDFEDGQLIDPHTDPSGERIWSDSEDQGGKKLRKVKFGD